jgi:hypothetical protein
LAVELGSRATLGHEGQAAYQRAASLSGIGLPLHDQLDLRFIPQQGRYADVTSVLNGADHLRAVEGLFVAFADSLYPHDNPSLTLAAVPPGHTGVLVRPYHLAEARYHGVVVSRRLDGEFIVAELVEKPSRNHAQELEADGQCLARLLIYMSSTYLQVVTCSRSGPGRNYLAQSGAVLASHQTERRSRRIMTGLKASSARGPV